MHSCDLARSYLRVLVFFALCFIPATGRTQEISAGVAQPAGDLFLKYEVMKKEKATALAWALLVPGGGVFYVGGHNEYGAGLCLIEAATLGSAIYVGDQISIGSELPGDRVMVKVFAALFLITKAVEVIHAFDLIDEHNQALWQELCRPPRLGEVRSIPRGCLLPPILTLVNIRIDL